MKSVPTLNRPEKSLPALSPSRRRVLASAAAGALWVATGARAASYPDKAIKIIVPFAPGAGTDAMGRLLAQKLGELLNVSVVVDNKTGASGAIGAQFVAQSPPDGYTLLLVAAPYTTVPAVLPTAGYDPLSSFTHISMVAQGPLMWACHKDLPVNNLAELVAYAKTRPGQLNYGSAGAGGINHLVLEQLKAQQGVSIEHIPYRGIAPAAVDMVGGQIQVLTGTIPALAPLVRDGRIKALAVTTAKRLDALKDLPTAAESGLPGFDLAVWHGVYAPKGTPKPVTDKLNASMQAALKDPAVVKRFADLGAVIVPADKQTPDGLARHLKAEIDKWAPIIKKAGQYAD